MKINNYREIIDTLLDLGYQVLQYELPYDDWGYMLVDKFEPNYSDSTGEFSYHTAIGIDITDFLNKNSASNMTAFRQALQGFIQYSSNVIKLEMQQNIRWYKWVRQ